MIFAKRFTYDLWQGSEYSSAVYTTIRIRVYQLEVLATICLFKFANIFHLNLGNIVHGQIQKQPPEVL